MLRLARGWEGGRKETSACLKLLKSPVFSETSEADLTPSIALGVTPAKRLMFDLSKSAYQTGAPRHRPISNHSPIWTSCVYVTVDTADCDEN
jgi:hypothetical protein